MAVKGQYKHVEAYCLMWYACERCGRKERLWNSRDGVTPFSIGCPDCGGTMQHVAWDLDDCQPEYTPYEGQRIFGDMTEEKKREYAVKMLGLIRSRGDFPDRADEDIIRAFSKPEYPGEPAVYVYTGKKEPSK